jgi:hypothetical protein
MRLLLAAALVAAASIAAIGQERPNFSGRWVAVSATAGSEQLVKHDATTFSLLHGSQGADHTATFKLDGTETRNATPSHGSQIVTVAKAEWVGGTVKITQSNVYPDGRKMQSTQLWWLDAQGHLVVEFTETFEGQKPTSGIEIRRKAN